MIIIGIDPDSEKHGVSFYIDGKIAKLESMRLFDLFKIIEPLAILGDVQIHIENVCGINATFNKQFVKNRRAETTVSRSLGMCQQAQVEVERMAEYLGVPVIKHPISKNWKSADTGKAALLKMGWSGQSNEDTRSAAYFGYLGVKAWHMANQK